MDTFAQCDPAKQVYGVYYNPQSGAFQCQSGNDDCQMKACMCDVEFVNTVVFRFISVFLRITEYCLLHDGQFICVKTQNKILNYNSAAG